jgi:hypothetical protein
VIAANAAEIVEMRKVGRQPASWVLVSFVGKIENDDNGFTVFALADKTYDWRWIVGLDVIVFAKKGLDVAPQLKAMRNERPKSLALWDVETKIGAEVCFDIPADHATAHRKAKNKIQGIELDPWAEWQRAEFIDMGF